ncbi:MAG: sulfur carrier protein ThiS [Pseudomonadota bacterium]|nr:sulfur carrier protein ThiS [Pseudomonadota bacterium]
MIEIILNGKTQQTSASTVSELADSLGLTNKRFAVEINQQVIPKAQHQQTQLNNLDKVEIVQAIGGG